MVWCFGKVPHVFGTLKGVLLFDCRAVLFWCVSNHYDSKNDSIGDCLDVCGEFPRCVCGSLYDWHFHIAHCAIIVQTNSYSPSYGGGQARRGNTYLTNRRQRNQIGITIGKRCFVAQCVHVFIVILTIANTNAPTRQLNWKHVVLLVFCDCVVSSDITKPATHGAPSQHFPMLLPLLLFC